MQRCRTYFLPGPWGSMGGGALQHAGTGGCEGLPHKDLHSWENDFTINLSLQASSWTCETC